jgi:hypothetical protein
MAADLKLKYPAADTTAITCAIASLASDTNLLAGRAGTAIDNSSNVDLDHLLSGQIMVGTTPTASTRIEVWVYAPTKIVSGTPTYVDAITGTDANKTMTSEGVKQSGLRLAHSINVDAATSNVGYQIPPTSIRQLFGEMPKQWGVFVVHNTGVALNATGGNHWLHYERIQNQSV